MDSLKPGTSSPGKGADALSFHPLTVERWADFEMLFGEHGAYGGCWCMWWRTTRSQFQEQAGEGNRQAMRAIVDTGEVPGILAYGDCQPLGWCSIAPREQYGSLNRSHVLKRLDEMPVWSIVCLFVAKGHRGEGLSLALIQTAVDYVRQQGGKVVEAYPTIPKNSGPLPPVSSFMGVPALFERAGFVECKRPSGSRVIVRCYLE